MVGVNFAARLYKYPILAQDMVMRRLLFTLFAVGWCFSLVSGAAKAQLGTAEPPAVQSVRFGDHGTMWRVVLDLSQPVRFQATVLPDPYRLSVELPPIAWQARQSLRFQAKGLLDGYQFNPAPSGGGRLIVTLRGPARVKEIQALEPRGGAGHRLVIDLEPVAATDFKSAGAVPLQPAPPARVESRAEPPVSPAPATQALATPVLTTPARAPIPPPRPPGPASGKFVIVIDPGHGGVDPGTTGHQGMLEKTLTLSFSRELKRALEHTGRYSVFVTRSDDRSLRLRDRLEYARRAKADLFLSVHADSLPDSSVRGASVYTLSDQASDKEAEALAAKENKADVIAGMDLTNENPVVASILIDLAQRETMNLSATFARYLVEEIAEPAQVLRKTHRFAGFAVLKAPDVPSVLLELGYISHPEEERLLLQPGYRQRIADAVVRAIDRWLAQERGNRTLSR